MENDFKTRLRQIANGYTRSRALEWEEPIIRYFTPSTEASLEVLNQVFTNCFPQFRLSEYNEFVFTELLRWLHGDPLFKALSPRSGKVIKGDLNKGIYLSGPTGTGKTFMLGVLHAYSLAMGFRIGFGKFGWWSSEREYSITRLLWSPVPADQIVVDYLTPHRGYSLDEYKQRRILCVEDLGREPLEAVLMGNRTNVLRNLLEHRGDKPNSLLIITSNLPINHPELLGRYGDRVVSRLYGMCNYYELGGPDHRINC